MNNKVVALLLGCTLFVGCGGSSDSKDTNSTSSSSSSGNTGSIGGGGDGFGSTSTSSSTSSSSSSSSSGGTPIQTGEGVYLGSHITLNSPISGVNYNCGLKSGVTNATGDFTFEIGEGCLFTINSIGLTSVSSAGLEAGLIDGAKTTVRPNHEVARYLQSLDNDNNPNNGINILPAVVQALNDNDILGVQRDDQSVIDMVTALTALTVYSGMYVSKEDSAMHLYGFPVNISAKIQGSTVTFDAGTGNIEGLTYIWKEGATSLGTGNPQIVDNFSVGTHTIFLSITKADQIRNFSFSISIQ